VDKLSTTGCLHVIRNVDYYWSQTSLHGESCSLWMHAHAGLLDKDHFPIRAAQRNSRKRPRQGQALIILKVYSKTDSGNIFIIGS
jgi:hypothetical protein